MGKGRRQPQNKGRHTGAQSTRTVAAPSGPPMRVLVVTAYYKEERALIERTIRSVAGQTAVAKGQAVVDHLLVADGFPQDWIAGAGVRHVALDRAHGDYGNTPRGYGSVLGIAEGYDAICYCDADNWYEPEHVETCLTAARALDGVDYVIARRIMRRPDETAIPIEDEPVSTHVDTNCFFFLPGSYHLIHHFANAPRELSIIGDRLFFGMLKGAKLKTVLLQKPTVSYLCLWEPVYRAIGETPPEGAKTGADHRPAEAWLQARSNRDRVIVARLTGLPLARPAGAPEPPQPPRTTPPRVLAITAYYKEPRAEIEACLASVAAQTARAEGRAIVDHLVIADGFPQGWLDGAGVRHLALDRSHGDYGNTPRGAASLLAISEGYDAFFYLDADNRIEPDHVAACLDAAAAVGPDCDWVMARRFLCRPDWTALPFAIDDGDVDTNCFFFLRGSHHMVHHFAAIPNEMSAIGDRLFHIALTAQPLRHTMVPHRTVDYLCLWREPYELAGEVPPEGAKPAIDQLAIRAWFDGLPERRREVVSRLIGFRPE